MLGNSVYSEALHAPEQGVCFNWNVWCHAGALQVLRKKEYEEFLTTPGGCDDYTINFANGAKAEIYPGHPLWEALAELTKSYTIEVFPRGVSSESYVSWTGDEKSPRKFDAISIKLKK